MNGVLFASGDKKTQLGIRLNWVSFPSIQPGQNWANLKSQNYKNISDLSIGFASFTSEFHIYLLRVSGQRDFLRISSPAPSVPPNVLGRAAEISDLLKPRNWIFENKSGFVGLKGKGEAFSGR